MIRYLDSLSVPNGGQLDAAKASGYSGWAGYIGGPSAAGVWSANAFASVRRAGLSTTGFYVGLGSVDLAVSNARDRLLPGEVVGHDVETNSDVSGLTDSYAATWAQAIRNAGFRPVLYGLPGLTARYGSYYDAVWFAGGSYYRSGANPSPNDPRESGFAQSNRKQAWQWWGTHNFNGIGVDESVCDDWFSTSGDVMDWNTVVKSWYLMFFKRNPAQSEIDGWVSRLKGGENGEQVLDEFLSGPEGQAYLRPAPPAASSGGSDMTNVNAQIAQIKKGLADASQ